MYKALTTIAENSVRQMQDLQQTQARLLANLTPAAGAQVTANRALQPLSHLGTYQELITQTITRQVRTYQGLWNLALQPRLDASLWAEGLAIQAAVMQRLATQQAQWVQGLESIASEIGSLKKVNTLSKLMDQESDIGARLNALIMGQATSMMELMESVQISIGYLVAQKEQEAGG